MAPIPDDLLHCPLLMQNCIDSEVVITKPEKWTEATTKETIDQHRGDGYYDMHGLFIFNNT